MAQSLINPFVYGRVLSLREAAARRPEFEKRVAAAIRDNARIALSGARRMGKSSIVQREIERANLPLLRLSYHDAVGVADVVMRSLMAVEQWLASHATQKKKQSVWRKSVLRQLQEISASLDAGKIWESASISVDHLRSVFRLIREITKKERLALFIDELQRVHSCLPDSVARAVIAVIREEVQHITDAAVIFAGNSSESFRRLFESPSSPFFEHASLLNIGAISGEDFEIFIKGRFVRAYGITDEAVALIIKIGGESPDDVQRLCHETWNHHLATGEAADTECVFAALIKILNDFGPLGENWMSNLSPKQLRIVFAITFKELVASSTDQFMKLARVRSKREVTHSLRLLTDPEHGLIEEERGGMYRFRSQYARLWFGLRRHQIQRLVPRMRVPEVYFQSLAGLLPRFPVSTFLQS
jgi:hypothetical protein